MIETYDCTGDAISPRPGGDIGDQTIWIDLVNPTAEEEALVEKALGIDVPTREEMREIEHSSRLYSEDGAHFMTASVLYGIDGPEPQTTDITFILAANRLVTVRYIEPKAFALLKARAKKPRSGCETAPRLLMGLLEAIIDREADMIERIQAEIGKLAHTIFEMRGGALTRQRRFEVVLKQIGRGGEVTTRARESMQSLQRLLVHFAQESITPKSDKDLRNRLKTATRDVQSLNDHLGFMTTRAEFLLDATLGLINIEENRVIKIFSILAIVLMPPTLIGTIYGMNFKHMPELGWVYGYPFALLLMVLSAIGSYLFFRYKGWW